MNHNYDSANQEEAISRRSPTWHGEYYYGSGAKKYQLNEYIERDTYSPRDIGWQYTYDYDNYGNLTPLDRYMHLDGYGDTLELSWKNATQIENITQTSSSNTTLMDRTYSYNGSNISKIENANGSYTEFYYFDNLLEYELRYNSSGNLTQLLKYCYDSSGRVEFLLSKTNQFFNPNAYNLYYYLHDGLDNVAALIRVKAQSGTSTVADNTLAAEYSYSAFGECTITNSYDTIASVNSIRFKDYYYDSDLKWYWLSTRYYDPEIGRFISPDDPSVMLEDLDTVYDKNPYVYCDNNPITRADNDGELWGLIARAAVGALIGAVTSIVSSAVKGEKINWKNVGKSALVGAATSAIGGPAIGKVVGKVASKIAPKATKIGTLVSKNHPKPTIGVRYKYKTRSGATKTRSIEAHFYRPKNKTYDSHMHAGRRFHWQMNSWKNGNSYSMRHWTWYGRRLPK